MEIKSCRLIAGNSHFERHAGCRIKSEVAVGFNFCYTADDSKWPFAETRFNGFRENRDAVRRRFGFDSATKRAPPARFKTLPKNYPVEPHWEHRRKS